MTKATIIIILLLLYYQNCFWNRYCSFSFNFSMVFNSKYFFTQSGCYESMWYPQLFNPYVKGEELIQVFIKCISVKGNTTDQVGFELRLPFPILILITVMLFTSYKPQSKIILKFYLNFKKVEYQTRTGRDIVDLSST